MKYFECDKVWQGRIQEFLKGVQGPRKGRSVGIVQTDKRKNLWGGYNPPKPPESTTVWLTDKFWGNEEIYRPKWMDEYE